MMQVSKHTYVYEIRYTSNAFIENDGNDVLHVYDRIINIAATSYSDLKRKFDDYLHEQDINLEDIESINRLCQIDINN